MRKGSALIVVLFIVSLLLLLAIGVSKLLVSNIKTQVKEREAFIQFQNADGGIYAVAGWMYIYRRFDVPREITDTETYKVRFSILKNTVRYPVGYSSAWLGFDVRLNSSSETKEVESVIFVPVTPVGYGNE